MAEPEQVVEPMAAMAATVFLVQLQLAAVVQAVQPVVMLEVQVQHQTVTVAEVQLLAQVAQVQALATQAAMAAEAMAAEVAEVALAAEDLILCQHSLALLAQAQPLGVVGQLAVTVVQE
jgi:hypothetical protein